MPLQEPVTTCLPLVRVWPLQTLIKFASSLKMSVHAGEIDTFETGLGPP